MFILTPWEQNSPWNPSSVSCRFHSGSWFLTTGIQTLLSVNRNFIKCQTWNIHVCTVHFCYMKCSFGQSEMNRFWFVFLLLRNLRHWTCIYWVVPPCKWQDVSEYLSVWIRLMKWENSIQNNRNSTTEFQYQPNALKVIYFSDYFRIYFSVI